MVREKYNWKRFWCPRGGSINLSDGKYLADPDGPYGNYFNPGIHTFEEISEIPCLALLGEPGIGKTSTMQAERDTIEAAVQAEGGKTLWLDLRSCGDESRLVKKLFESREFILWEKSDYRLHLFLDSLDECLLRVDNVAALLIDELRNYPVERLSLRIGCRTAEWPTRLLENGLRELWGDENFRAYELAPLRRTDVAAAATVKKLDPDAFLEAVNEAGVVPLAIKPVTLEFLIGSYSETGTFPTGQADLYLEGCRWLCEERNDNRVAYRRTDELSPDQRLAVAARIAAVTVFSNKYAVWNGIQQAAPEKEDVLVRTLAGGTEFVGEDKFPVGEDAIREVLGTGLFSARGPEKLGWAHQTYAEFLAARYLMQRSVHVDKAKSLLTHPDDEQGKLAPQLHETAAWLASMSPEVFRAIADADPEVLLRSDVANTDVEDKTALVDTLLQLYDEEELLNIGLVPYRQYRKLEHSELAEQLRPYVVDSGKGIVARCVALDIAEACELRSLQGAGAEVALDPDQPFLVRKEAARFVAHVGDSSTRARLKPLATGDASNDPDGDLQGWGLEAVWPEHMDAEELFASLTLPNENYLGSYAYFLNQELPERLRPSDLPVALAWVEDQQRRHDMSYRIAELMDQIMLRSWELVDIPEVQVAFAKAALARLKQHDELVQERSSIAIIPKETSFQDRIDSDDEKRRGLVEEMLSLIDDEEDDASALVYSRTPLVLTKDVAWLIEKLETEVLYHREKTLAALIRRAFDLWNDEQYELVYWAYQKIPALANEVGHFFDPVELSSELAKEQREYHEESQERRARREQRGNRPVPDPPLVDRVARALDDIEADYVDAFWQRLDYYLKFDEHGHSRTSSTEWDFTALPGWKAADVMRKERIVRAAKRYILEGEPGIDGWLGETVLWETHPADAGYRALRLLVSLAPDFVAEMPDGAWARWTPVILDYPVTTGTGETEPHLELAAMAYRHAPATFIGTLLFLIEKKNEEKGSLSILGYIKKCWDDQLARALLEKAKDPRLKPSCLEPLLGELLDYGLEGVRTFTESLASSWPESDEEKKARALAAARTLVFHADDAGWSVVWPAMLRDTEFADEMVSSMAGGARRVSFSQEHLSERQAADLYIWLVRRYPHSEYYIEYRSGVFTTFGFKEDVSQWRDDVPRDLQQRGTVEACRQLERIMAELPQLQDRLKRTLYQAKAETRRRTWTAPDPQHVLDLVAKRSTRIVQNGDQLLEVIIESLHRLEASLQGETPTALALWNERDNGTFRPRNEEVFSDQVKGHLERDLEGKGVVVNREVVIRRGVGSGRGERTDIKVEAVVQNPRTEEHDTLTVIIESKGCWHQRLHKDMQAQLAERYLRDTEYRHGLYLVGWFICPQWDTDDPRQVSAARRDLAMTRKRLEIQASKLSQGDLHVRPVILNTALR